MKYIRTKDGRIVDVSLMQEFETDDAEIILTSSWKNGYSILQENETVQLQELRAKFNSFGLAINGRTKDLQNRMQEIDEYIRVHDIKIYAIF